MQPITMQIIHALFIYLNQFFIYLDGILMLIFCMPFLLILYHQHPFYRYLKLYNNLFIKYHQNNLLIFRKLIYLILSEEINYSYIILKYIITI